MKHGSKPLGRPDISGFIFDKEMLAGDETNAINFDRIQWDNKKIAILYLNYCDVKKGSLKEELLHTLVIPIIIFAKILGNGFRCGGWPKILTPSCI